MLNILISLRVCLSFSVCLLCTNNCCHPFLTYSTVNYERFVSCLGVYKVWRKLHQWGFKSSLADLVNTYMLIVFCGVLLLLFAFVYLLPNHLNNATYIYTEQSVIIKRSKLTALLLYKCNVLTWLSVHWGLFCISDALKYFKKNLEIF